MSAATRSESLYAQLGLVASPTIVDARREDDYGAEGRIIPGARRGDPERIAQWAPMLARTRPIVVYCRHGRDLSQSAAATLQALGHQVSHLDGGIDRWIADGYATVRVRPD